MRLLTQQSGPWPNSGDHAVLRSRSNACISWQLGRFIQGFGRKGPSSLAEVKAGLAEVQGNPGKREETMPVRDPKGRRAGDRLQITGSEALSGTRSRVGEAEAAQGPAGEVLRILQCCVCVSARILSARSDAPTCTFGDCSVGRNLVLHPKAPNTGSLL